MGDVRSIPKKNPFHKGQQYGHSICQKTPIRKHLYVKYKRSINQGINLVLKAFLFEERGLGTDVTG